MACLPSVSGDVIEAVANSLNYRLSSWTSDLSGPIYSNQCLSSLYWFRTIDYQLVCSLMSRKNCRFLTVQTSGSKTCHIWVWRHRTWRTSTVQAYILSLPFGQGSACRSEVMPACFQVYQWLFAQSSAHIEALSESHLEGPSLDLLLSWTHPYSRVFSIDRLICWLE